MITILGPGYKEPEGVEVINTTSRSTTWSRGLSPFFLGPIKLYSKYRSINMENAWQYSKVYEYYLEDDDTVGDRYFKWAQEGWNSIRAHRYPMGRDAKPLYSYWDGEKLSYIEARKKIYIPLYAEAVQKTYAFQQLKKKHEAGEDLYLWDFDGYNHRNLGMSYEDVINDPNKKMGHAFAIAMLLENFKG